MSPAGTTSSRRPTRRSWRWRRSDPASGWSRPPAARASSRSRPPRPSARPVETEVCPLFFALGSGGSLERHFERAGFTNIRSERLSTTLEYPNEQAALSAAFEGGPVAMAYGRFDDAVRAEAHRDYLETIADFRVGDGYRIPGEFVVVRGEKG